MTLTAAPQTKLGYYDSVAGRVYTGALMPFGLGIGTPVYWNNSFPFANLMKHAAISENTAVPGTEVNDYYDSTSSGNTKYITHAKDDERAWDVQIGTYILRWTGTGDVNWSIVGAGTATETNLGAGGYPTVNRREYVVTGQKLTSGAQVNSSGGFPTSIELCLAVDEARLNAGQVCSTLLLSDLAGVDHIRMVDMMDTSDSRLREVADEVPYDNAIYWFAGHVPAKACALMANELDCKLWFNAPAKATDALHTSLATALATNLDAGRECWIEYSNEIWNLAAPWSDGSNYVTYLDVTEQEATSVVDGLITLAGHGVVSGDIVYGFNPPIPDKQLWPFAFGAGRAAAVYSSSTFRIGRENTPPTVSAVTKELPAAVTTSGAHGYTTGDIIFFYSTVGMTELDNNEYAITVTGTTTFTLDGVDSTLYGTFVSGRCVEPLRNDSQGSGNVSDVSSYYFKNSSDAVQINISTNYATKAIAVWPLYEAQIGAADMIKLCCSQSAQPITLAGRLAGGLRGIADLFAIAPYFNTKTVAPDYENYTFQQGNDWAMTGGDYDKKVEAFVENTFELGTYRLITYECSDHNGGNTGQNQAQKDWVKDYASSPEMEVMNAWHYEEQSLRGYQKTCGYYCHGNHTGDNGTWGHLKWPGDTTSKKYVAIKPFLDGAGVPKRNV